MNLFQKASLILLIVSVYMLALGVCTQPKSPELHEGMLHIVCALIVVVWPVFLLVCWFIHDMLDTSNDPKFEDYYDVKKLMEKIPK